MCGSERRGEFINKAKLEMKLDLTQVKESRASAVLTCDSVDPGDE